MNTRFTGNVIIDKQEKNERNLKAFRAAMKRLNPDVGFVEQSLGNHRGDFSLQIERETLGPTERVAYALIPNPEIRVETKWLSDRGPTDLFSSLSTGYDRIKKEFEFLGSIKAPLFLAQGKDSDFIEHKTPGGVTWEKTLNTLFSLNARFRVPVVWTDDAPEFLAMFLHIASRVSPVEGSWPLSSPRKFVIIDDVDSLLSIVGHEDNYGTQFFCSFRCPGIHGTISELIQSRGFGFWFFDHHDPQQMAERWLVHETKATAIHASGGFTPNPENYSGAIRSFGPGKNQYLPKNRKVRQKRKACVAFDNDGENPVFLVFNPPKKTGCEIEILSPERLNGDYVEPSSITGMKDLAPHNLCPIGKVKDRAKDETEVIPDILRFLNNHWAKGEQKPKIEAGEEFEEFEDDEEEPLSESDLPYGWKFTKVKFSDILIGGLKDSKPKSPAPYPPDSAKAGEVNDCPRCSNNKLNGRGFEDTDTRFPDECAECKGEGFVESPAPYPPLYVEPEPESDWQSSILDRIERIIKTQTLIRTELNAMNNLPATSQPSQTMLNDTSPGEVEKALLEVCGLGKASPAMQIVALKMANRYGFSLELKHVIPVKGNLYITRDGLLHIAHKSGKLDGIEVIDEGKDPKGGWWAKVAVYRKDMSKPFTYKGRYNGPNKNFGPEMAIKCAESMCLRRAFDVSLCSREERWDVEAVESVEEVKDVDTAVSNPVTTPIVTTTHRGPSNITIVAAEVLDAKPTPPTPPTPPRPQEPMRYDNYEETLTSGSLADVSKTKIVKTIRDQNIPLQYDFCDGSPVVEIMHATAQFYGADSWETWTPDAFERVDACQFLEFFGWVCKEIDFDAAFSLVEQGKVPAKTGPTFMEEFLKSYEKPESKKPLDIYNAICLGLTLANVPF